MFSNFSLNELNNNQSVIQQTSEIANKFSVDLKQAKEINESLSKEIIELKSDKEKTLKDLEDWCRIAEKYENELKNIKEDKINVEKAFNTEIKILKEKVENSENQLKQLTGSLEKAEKLLGENSDSNDKFNERLEKATAENIRKIEAKDLKIELQGIEIRKLTDDLSEMLGHFEQLRIVCRWNLCQYLSIRLGDDHT